MDDLKNLIAWINIDSQYTHSVSESDFDMDYDVYDCFLSRTTNEVSLYGGLFNSKTFYVKGFGQVPARSRRQNGDELQLPDVVTVLETVVADAAAIDYTSGFGEWADTYHNHVLIRDAEKLLDTYRSQVRLRNELAEFLGRNDWDTIENGLEDLSS